MTTAGVIYCSPIAGGFAVEERLSGKASLFFCAFLLRQGVAPAILLVFTECHFYGVAIDKVSITRTLLLMLMFKLVGPFELMIISLAQHSS